MRNQDNIQFDELDAKIVSVLGKDSRKPYGEIGVEVGLSAAAVHDRVKKMIERGVILNFSLRLDALKVGQNFTAYVAIRNDGGEHCRDIASRLAEISEMLELHSVAGEYDYLAKVRTTHARALEDILYRIKAIPGIARTTSTVVLNTEFEDRPPALGG